MQTKTRKASTKRSSKRTEAEKLQFAKEWLEKEAAAGRMILAKHSKKFKFPDPPTETIDFWPAYNETRADRFF